MISKMKPGRRSRLAIVFNGSPLFTGDAGSGESNIRRWIIENDWLEAIVALPDQLFYNTGISTYIWIVTNRKRPERQGKVQLIDATGFFQKMRKSLGNKRNELSDEHIAEITRIYGEFDDGEHCKIFANAGLRLSQDHRRAAAAAELPGERGAASSGCRPRRLPEGQQRSSRAGDAAAACPATSVHGSPAFEAALKTRCQGQRPQARRSAQEGDHQRTLRARRDGSRSVSTPRATPSLTQNCATPRTCRSARTSTSTWPARCCPTCQMPGSMRAKTKIGYEINFNRYFYTLRAAAAAGGDRG